jgi:hypothetical protein
MARSPGAGVHGQAPELPRARPPGGPRGARPAEARRRPRRARGPVPAQQSALRHCLLRRAEGRRDGGELLAARRRESAGAQDRGQPHRHPRHPRPRRAVPADGRDARPHAAEDAGGRQSGGDGAGTRHADSADESRPPARRRGLGRAAPALRRPARQRRRLRAARHRRPGAGAGGAAVHRRHDRAAQGRHADARQPGGRLPAVTGRR